MLHCCLPGGSFKYFSIYFSFSKKVFNNYFKVINIFNRVINN
nr:MAG TPA: hypothetical protein [Caudoviricetes sp.]